jgi:hypothetical protein
LVVPAKDNDAALTLKLNETLSANSKDLTKDIFLIQVCASGAGIYVNHSA